MDFAIPADKWVKIKKWKDRQIFGPCQRTKKIVWHKDDSNTNCGKRTGWIGNQRMNWEHPDNSIKIG